MNELQFEDIIEKYPELIEDGLVLRGRQVRIDNKIFDLLFEDRHNQTLIVELKVGPIKRKHIGQVMDYEGQILSPDDPNVRIMLVGNRVPSNFRRSLDFHGIEWRELPYNLLIDFLKKKNDSDFLSDFPDSAIEKRTLPKSKAPKSQVVNDAPKTEIYGIDFENEENAINLFGKIKDSEVLYFCITLMRSLTKKISFCRAVKNEFKFWLSAVGRCSIYIRPFSNRIDIYIEKFSPSDVIQKSNYYKIPIVANQNTHNPADQFKSVIVVTKEWLTNNKEKSNGLQVFLDSIIEELIQDVDLRLGNEISSHFTDIAVPADHNGMVFAQRMLRSTLDPIRRIYNEYNVVPYKISRPHSHDFDFEYNRSKSHGSNQFIRGGTWWAYRFGSSYDMPPNDVPNISIIANLTGIDVCLNAELQTSQKVMIDHINNSTKYFDRLISDHAGLWFKTYLKFEHQPRFYHWILCDFYAPGEYDGATILNSRYEHEESFLNDRQQWIERIRSGNLQLTESQIHHLESRNKQLNLAIRLVYPFYETDPFWSLPNDQKASEIVSAVHRLKPFIDFFVN